MDSLKSDCTRGKDPESPSKKRKSLSSIEHNQREIPPPGQANPETDDDASVSPNSQINKYWREKICEWAYQGKQHRAL